MENNNRLLTALLLGIIFLSGIFIGNRILPQKTVSQLGIFSNPDKISTLIDLIRSRYVDEIPDDSLAEMVIPEILKKLDPHSSYIPAKDMAAMYEPLEGNFDGIGVQFNIQNDTIYVVDVIAGGPAEKEGVRDGDRIVSINDSLVAGIKITNQKVMNLLKGEGGTKVKIEVKRIDVSKLIQFEITRGNIPINSVDAAFLMSHDIGLIKISRFSRTTFDEFTEAAQNLKNKGMKKLILDLRQNGGGYLDAAVELSDEFLSDKKMIVYTAGNSGLRNENIATDKGEFEEMPLVVLIDAWSASASEIVAGAMQDNDRATIIGRRSFGKGLVQESYDFSDGSGLRLTVARYYTATGRCIQKPYSGKGNEYEDELYHRSSNGEFLTPDSVHFNDSLKFKTPKGRIVYGGGGIMPDLFVPMDTSYYSKYYDLVLEKNLMYDFAIEYSDKNRKLLSSFKTLETLSLHLEKIDIEALFLKRASKMQVIPSKKDIQISQKKINQIIRAYIVRNILNENDFYRYYSQNDNDCLKALSFLTGKP